MKVKLTGIIEFQIETEVEIDEYDLYNYIGDVCHPADTGGYVLKYLRDYSDFETEIWASAPGLEDGDVLTAEFIEAEVLDE